MISGSETYGATFLAALDQQLGRSVFRFSERNSIRKMDRERIVRKMRSHSYQLCQAAKNVSPEELAGLVSDCLDLKRTRGNDANADSDLDDGLPFLLILACL